MIFSTNACMGARGYKVLHGFLSAFLLLCVWMPVQAVDYVISDAQTTEKVLGIRDTLTVTSTGSITAVKIKGSPYNWYSYTAFASWSSVAGYGNLTSLTDDGQARVTWERHGRVSWYWPGSPYLSHFYSRDVRWSTRVDTYRDYGSADVTNSGSIGTVAGTGNGITSITSNTTVTNNAAATISAMGEYSRAVSVDNINAIITNSGTISATGSYSSGVSVANTLFGNQPRVSMWDYYSDNPRYLSEIIMKDLDGTSVNLTVRDIDATITNNSGGTIKTLGDWSKAVYVRGHNVTITNNTGGTISSAGSYSSAVYVSGDNASVTNRGTISTSGSDSKAVHLRNSDATLTNSGTITATGGGVAIQVAGATINLTGGEVSASGSSTVAIATDGESTEETVNMSGSAKVTGNINLGAGVDEIYMSDVISSVHNYSQTARVNGDVNLGSGKDLLKMNFNSIIGGDVDLGSGSDVVKLYRNAKITGVIDLGVTNGNEILVTDDAQVGSIGFDAATSGAGAGADSVVMRDTARIGGNVSLGADSDNMDLFGSASVAGDIDMGAGDDDVTLGNTTTKTFTNTETGETETREINDSSATPKAAKGVNLGTGMDTLEMFSASEIGGDVAFDSADAAFDTVRMADSSKIIGSLTTGAGNDMIYMGDKTSNDNEIDQAPRIGGNVSLGAGSNRMEMDYGSTVGGNVSLGGGGVLKMEGDSAVGGDVSLGTVKASVGLSGKARVVGMINLGVDDATDDDDGNIIHISGKSRVGGGINYDVATAKAGAGDDKVYVYNRARIIGKVSLGAGNDSIDLFNKAQIKKGKVFLGKGHDEITVTDSAGITGKINFGNGRDILTVRAKAVVKAAVSFGDGQDKFYMGDSRDTNPSPKLVGDVAMGAGRDYMMMLPASTIEGTVNTGSQNDEIFMHGNSKIDGDVNMERGVDYLGLFPGARITGDVNMGAGEDTIYLSDLTQIDGYIEGNENGPPNTRCDPSENACDSSVGGSINAGPGDDTVTMAAGARVAGKIDMGTGADTLNWDVGGASASAMLNISGVENFNPLNAADTHLLTIFSSSRAVLADFSLLAADGRMFSDVTAKIHNTISQSMTEYDGLPGAKKTMWSRELNSIRDSGRSSQAAAHRHDYSGFVNGYADHSNAIRYGFVFGISDADLNADGLRARKTAKTTFSGGYGQMDIGSAWDLAAILLIGSEEHSNTHYTNGNRQVLGDFSSAFSSFSLNLNGEYGFGKYTLRPSAMLIGNRSHADGYTETLTTANAERDSLLTYDRRLTESTLLRVQTAMDIPLENAGNLEIFAGVQSYRVDGSDITGSLGDARFIYSLSVNEAHGAFIGGSLSAQFRSGLRVKANFETGQFTGDERYLSGKLEFNYAF